MLSLIIPIHNDGDRLIKNWNELYFFLSNNIKDFEIILAEDGSIDDTYKICLQLKREYKNVKISHYKNKLGRGMAIKRACRICSGKYIGYIDSDLSTDVSFIINAVNSLKKNDIVVGSRYVSKSNSKRKMYRMIISLIYNTIVNVILHNNVHDNQCGFKFFRKDVVMKLNNMSIMNHWSWDTEIIFLSKKYGHKVMELPVSWREKSQSKVKFKDVFDMFINIFRIRSHRYRAMI